MAVALVIRARNDNWLMYQSTWSFIILPPGNPPGIWTFEDWPFQIFSPRGKKAVQISNQLVLKYLSSKTNFVFMSQTLFTLFSERYAIMTPSNFFFKRRLKCYSLTMAKFSLANPSNPAKTEKPHGRITLERDKSGPNSPLFQGNVQIPPSPGTMQSNS